AFFHVHETGKAFVALKLALSLDARLAARPGERTVVTGAAARDEARRLRGGYSAVAVGIGTVLADDPRLTVPAQDRRGPPPVRVVFDTDLYLPVGSTLEESTDEAPLWLVCAEDAPAERLRRWTPRVPVVSVPRAAGGLDLAAALAALRQRGLESIFVEGGGRLAASLLRSDLVDWLHLFHAPILLGDEGVPAFPGVGPGAPAAVRDAWKLVRTATFEDDVLAEYRRQRGPAAPPVAPGTHGGT
ncbi:MAG TPA: RibD family protein, partial [Longimicrobiales bacterium]